MVLGIAFWNLYEIILLLRSSPFYNVIHMDANLLYTELPAHILTILLPKTAQEAVFLLSVDSCKS